MAFVTRLVAAAVGTRVASASGKYGIWGAAAGLLATSAVLRWPGKAALVGLTWGASRLLSDKKQPVALIENHSPAASGSSHQP